VRHRTLIFCASLFFSATANSQDPTAGIPESSPFKIEKTNAIELLDGEVIDYRTGSLSWEIPLLEIPGDGDNEIHVSISYKKAYKPTDSGLYDSAANWSLEIPRLKLSGATPFENDYTPCLNPYLDRSYHDSSGNQQIRYMASGVTILLPNSGPITLMVNSGGFPEKYQYVSKENWVAECTNNGKDFLVSSPSGQTYYFPNTNSAGESLTVILQNYNILDDPDTIIYASRVEDKFGNSLSYEYVENNFTAHINPQYESVTHIKQKLPVKIESSNGDTINFSYNNPNPGRLPGDLALREMEFNGKAFKFHYDSMSRLSAIERPSSNGFSPLNHTIEYHPGAENYPYGNTLLKSLKKDGVEVSYEYTNLPISQIIQTQSPGDVIAVSKRTLHWRSGDNDYNFTYSKNSQNNITTIENERITKIYFSRDRYKFGLIEKLDKYDQSNQIIKTEEYEWEVGPRLGYLAYAALPIHKDGLEYWRYLKEKTIDKSFKTSFFDYDQYGYPQRIIESGDKQRETSYTYEHPNVSGENQNSPWVVGLIKEELIHGYSDEPTKTISYNQLYMPATMNDHGVVYGYEYTSTGNTQSVTKGYGSETPATTIFSNHTRGRPRRIERPDGSVLIKDYDVFGREIYSKNARGYAQNYEYYYSGTGNFLKLVDITYIAPELITYEFHADGYEEIRQHDRYQERTYNDGLGNIASKSTADSGNWVTTDFLYDKNGRLKFASNIDSEYGLEYEYDDLDRITKIRNTADGSIADYYYDDDCTQLISSYGRQASMRCKAIIFDSTLEYFEYESFGDPEKKDLSGIGQLSEKIDSPSPAPQWVYTKIYRNIVGDISRVERGDFFQKYQYYDSGIIGSLQSYRSSEAKGTYYYNYDDLGYLFRESLVYGPAGGVIEQKYFTRDPMGRVLFIDNAMSGDRLITNTYDPDGNLSSSSIGKIKKSYSYRPDNTLFTEEFSVIDEGNTAFSRKFIYAQDYMGHLSEMGYPGAQGGNNGSYSVIFRPDAYGRATQASGYVDRAMYYPNGDYLYINFSNNTTSRFEQNSATQLIDSYRLFDENVIDLLKYDISYSASGSVSSMQKLLPGQEISMRQNEYDGLNRLTRSIISSDQGNENHDRNYTYDIYGNLTKNIDYGVGGLTKILEYDESNRILKVSKKTNLGEVITQAGFEYDYRGNVTNYMDEAFISYDEFNKPISINIGTSEIRSINYRYTADGSRLYKGVHGPDGLTDKINFFLYGLDGKLLTSFDLINLTETIYIYLNDDMIASKESVVSPETLEQLSLSATLLDESIGDSFYDSFTAGRILAPLNASRSRGFSINLTPAPRELNCFLLVCKVLNRYEYRVYSEETPSTPIISGSEEGVSIEINDIPIGEYRTLVDAVYKEVCLFKASFLCLGLSEHKVPLSGQNKTIVGG
tara:strand:- start:12072 stop:16295 length:4224 start_codon:yes stop_codon:yes gene_type:complete